MEKQEDLVAFQQGLAELYRTPAELAAQMRGWGDHRSAATIVRSIHRMASGETALSGEMRVIINMLLYQQHMDEAEYAAITWQDHSNASYSAKIGEFTLSLYPQTKGRWHISIVHQSGYSHPWPSWQNNVDAAKRKAFICLGDAKRHVLEYERDQKK